MPGTTGRSLQAAFRLFGRPKEGAAADAEEPTGVFDEQCRLGRMRYFMRKAVDDAADNSALEADRADIMSALAVARQYCRADDVEQCRLFIRAVTALARFLGFRNALNDRAAWGKSALEVAVLLGDDLAIAELCASTIAWPLLQLGDYPEAERYCLEGLAAARRCGDSPAAARWAGNASRSLSGIARDADDGAAARHWAEQAALHARSSGDAALGRGAQLDIGYAELLGGDFETAERLFAGLLAFEEQGGDRERIANRSGDVALAVMNRALRSTQVEERIRLCDQARANVERSLGLGREIEHAVLLGECEISLATVARIRGDEETYRRMMASGRRRFAELGISREGRAEQFVVFPDQWDGIAE